MTKTSIKKKSVFLSKNIIPSQYDLVLQPDLLSSTFSGKETIKITVNSDTKSITLHSKDIDIETVKYIIKKEEQFATRITYNIDKETTTFYFRNTIEKGKGSLSIIFSGIINDNLRGFYRSKYILDGIEKHIATTQFEATDARRAFPCFDEPSSKAIFNVSLIIPNNHTAISNTLPINISEHTSGFKIVSFSPTPIMSTYLLAFITGEFEYIEGKTRPNGSSGQAKDGVQVRIFTTQGKKHQGKFALDVAIKSLEFYNEYFDIPYPLQTLDMIAIPDFESGAMENWGAVTYRETAILVDLEHTSLSNKRWVALVIAHELAHQWFGNLVTMHWWTDLWLNEGFASYIEYLAIDKIFPEWNIWDQFLTSDIASALRLDSLKNSHPIEVKVHHPNEINEIFDQVSYSKGASIIRMLASYLGEDKFRIGLQHYLKKHSYKNTKTVDLWNSFEKVSKKPIAKMMNNWTKYTGYPLLTLEAENNIYKISQQRFFSSRTHARKNNNKTIWYVPFKYKSNEDIFTELLTKKSSFIIGSSIGKINIDEESLVRVQYDKETLSRLKKQIELGALPLHDRLGIIRDLFALAEGGYISTNEALEFSLSFKNEQEYIVWSEIASGINRIKNIIHKEKYIELYNSYVLYLFSPLADKLGWNKKINEKHSDTFLRTLALSQSGLYGDKKIIKEARLIFKNRNNESVNADVRGVVYSIVAKYGKAKEWNEFKDMYEGTDMHEEKDRYARALTLFEDKDIIAKTLNYALSKNVRNQDAPHLFANLLTNNFSRDLAWKYMKNNWSVFLKRYGEGGHFLSRLVTPIGNFTKYKYLSDIKKFFEKNLTPGAERSLEQSYEKIESNIAWLESDNKKIKKWLEINYK